jgi:nucleoid-associated protein YgaU
MRSVLLLLALAITFGAAAAWQSRKVEALHAERARAAAIRDGELADTPSGEVRAGWAVVTVGRPSGKSQPRTAEAELDEGLEGLSDETLGASSGGEFDADTAASELSPADAAGVESQADESWAGDDWAGDYELIVEPGQSLSKIAAAHYGSAPEPLVTALARYNGMGDPDQLGAGQRLRLPPLDLLLRQ